MKYELNLQLFAPYTGDTGNSVTTQTTLLSDLSPEMKTFYDKALIRFAKPNLVHDQFAQIRNIPKNGGKQIEFRKYDQLPKATTPLTEGVTPNSQNLKVTTIDAEVHQYGGFIQLSDVLMLTAIDNNLTEAIELLGDQAGRTLDTITRDIINAGNNVNYAGTATSRATLTSADTLKVVDIKKAVRKLKVGLAKKIDGYYVAIIHPDVAFDIMADPEWISASEYAGSTQLFEGEIGKIHGVRFIETTEAKIISAGVYSTLVLGANAYGTTSVEGGGLETIVKQLGSAGTADPLTLVA